MSIFKAYDIRGIYPLEINIHFAEKLGFSFAKYLLKTHKKPHILIGRDGRLGSSELLIAFVNGARAANIEVDIVGLCTTPAIYILTAENKYTAGIMVTASHNPKEYNGFKFCDTKGINIGAAEGLEVVKTIFETNKHPKIPKLGRKVRVVSQLFSSYISHIAKKLPVVTTSRPIIIDCSNGVAAKTLPLLFKEKEITYHGINTLIDGDFPGHDPNPTKPENYAQIANHISHSADAIGIMFDGDADRIFLVDEKGKMVPSSVTYQILYDCYKGRNAVFDVITPKDVPDTIETSGGKAIISKVGMGSIKKNMIAHNAPFGGEMSGHFAHSNIHYADDAVFNAVLVVDYLSKTDKKLFEIVKEKAQYKFLQEAVTASNIPTVLDRIKVDLQQYLYSELDGLSFDAGDWRANVRPSNTEPVIRITVESKEADIASQVLTDIKNKII